VRATSQIATFESLDSAERREAIRLAIDKRDADYGEKEQALLELFAGFMRQAQHWIPAAFRTNPYSWESFRQLRRSFCD
jgi:hypothetical protein